MKTICAVATVAAFVAASASTGSAAPPPTLTSSVTNLNSTYTSATVTWSGVQNPSSSDWITVQCLPGGEYYWWYYVESVASSASQEITLWANGKASNCDSISIEYVGGSTKNFSTSPISVAPMIQQVHLSITNDPTAVVVDFVSSAGGLSAFCSYGVSPDALTMQAAGTLNSYSTIGGIAYALLTNLAANTTYYYACTDGVATSSIYNFVNQPAPTGRPLTIAVWADFGVDDGFGLDQITSDADNNAFDLILHAGDWAYDFETGQSANGNFFMNRATMYSTRYPVLPAPGNHEAGANFTEYKVRHSGVAAHSNTGNPLFYSVNWQGIHFLAFNSETYIAGGIQEMLDFVRSDLASVDRSITPWVVAFSHKLWWMDSTDFSSLSVELQAGGVDLLFAGHWHFYQRYVPLNPNGGGAGKIVADTACLSADNHTYTDPSFITMIVSGAPGDVERNDACPGDASIQPFTPACSPGYGYGKFAVYNSTYLRWDFTAVQTPIGETKRMNGGSSTSGAPPDTYQDYVIIRKTKTPVSRTA